MGAGRRRAERIGAAVRLAIDGHIDEQELARQVMKTAGLGGGLEGEGGRRDGIAVAGLVVTRRADQLALTVAPVGGLQQWG